MSSLHISLRPGKSASISKGGFYWHIFAGTSRAGAVSTNIIDEPPLGRHASISIQLNKTHQGKGIGRIAYGLACRASGFPTVYAHMRKSNLASRKAAEHAGFVVVHDYPGRQLLMRWDRSAQNKTTTSATQQAQ